MQSTKKLCPDEIVGSNWGSQAPFQDLNVWRDSELEIYHRIKHGKVEEARCFVSKKVWSVFKLKSWGWRSQTGAWTLHLCGADPNRVWEAARRSGSNPYFIDVSSCIQVLEERFSSFAAWEVHAWTVFIELLLIISYEIKNNVQRPRQKLEVWSISSSCAKQKLTPATFKFFKYMDCTFKVQWDVAPYIIPGELDKGAPFPKYRSFSVFIIKKAFFTSNDDMQSQRF